MGVNLRDIANPVDTEMEDLSGKAIAVDALNTIYQFLSIIRDRMTGEPLKDSQGRVTSHLSGLFYRTTRMMESGITPVFIFDGKPPEFKRGVQQARREIREQAREKLQQAVKEGDREKIRLYSQQTSKVTDDMLDDCTPTGDEICDELDNDCDGAVDEDFDLDSDVVNCGVCGYGCAVPNGTPACVGGSCMVDTCVDGYHDLNGGPADGCVVDAAASHRPRTQIGFVWHPNPACGPEMGEIGFV